MSVSKTKVAEVVAEVKAEVTSKKAAPADGEGRKRAKRGEGKKRVLKRDQKFFCAVVNQKGNIRSASGTSLIFKATKKDGTSVEVLVEGENVTVTASNGLAVAVKQS